MRKYKIENLGWQNVAVIVAIAFFLLITFKLKLDEDSKTLLIFTFYFIISLIYRIDSRFPIIAAIILLVSAAVYLQSDEKFANKLAIYAYYFLVIGVVLQLIEYVREKEGMEE